LSIITIDMTRASARVNGLVYLMTTDKELLITFSLWQLDTGFLAFFFCSVVSYLF